MIRHIVLLKFSKNVSTADIHAVLNELGELRHTAIPEINDFSYGSDCSVEGFNRDFQYAITMRFHSTEDRNHYLKHPAHAAMAEKIVGLLEDNVNSVLTFDYAEIE